MSKAFLDGRQHVHVAARLYKDDPVGMKSGEVKRRGEEIAPTQAPENRPVEARQDAGDEDGRGGVVGQLGATGYLVQRTLREPMARQVPIDRLDTERKRTVPNA